jgi:hypothetical protein
VPHIPLPGDSRDNAPGCCLNKAIRGR